jgi:predicted RNA-binding protein with PUA-like domain
MPAYWLIKSEPYKYSWQQLVADGETSWEGVRNFEARNNLRAMKVGDLALYYHSNEGKEVVGVARVVRTAYQDPTTDEDWSVVDVAPLMPLATPVGLAEIKTTPALSEMQLLKRSRLSVVPVTRAEFDTILRLGKTKLSAKRARSTSRTP